VSAVGVTAIVVAFNGTAVLERCVRTLRRTLYRPLEILVVDNGSIDGSVDRLEAVAGDDLRVLRLGANLGFSAGVVAGIEDVERRWPRPESHVYALVNQDCFVDPTWLGPLVTVLSSSPEVAVVGGALFQRDHRCLQHAGAFVLANGLTQHRGRGRRLSAEYARSEDVPYVTGAMCAFRADTWRRLGGFDPRFYPVYFEEADFCLRARELGMRVVFEPAAQGVHVEAMSSGGLGSAYLGSYHRNRMRFAARHLLRRGRWTAAVAAELRWLAGNRGKPLGAPLLQAYLRLPFEVCEALRQRRNRDTRQSGLSS